MEQPAPDFRSSTTRTWVLTTAADVFRASGMLGGTIPVLAAVARLLGRRLPHAA
jgi:hypothetical protein